MFSSKELYMMNAGDKRYILTDGFADVYQATPQEEAAWKSELIKRNMEVIRAESNPFSLKQAIETLSFHHYEKTTEYIRDQISQSGPGKQIVLAAALWASTRYHESFALLCLHFAQDPVSYRDDFFLAMQEFYNHSEARKFAIDCVEGNDADLYTRVIALLAQWQSKGIFGPGMSEVTEGLRQRKDFTTVAPYMAQLRQLLGIYNHQQPI